ncbi:MAG TPA: MarR family winged helix-turn-helix transcriptional regulator [Streptosporangiaceae bacterium]|nr:MarR family winged helix-turn-helix transcriptional regulator [Streptosporangiaceae bacterium]
MANDICRLRHFLQWSQVKAAAVGLTPARYQLLLAVKGHPGQQGPTVGDLAGYLLLRPHSAGELIDRAEASGLVDRWEDPDDRWVIRVRLTAEGDRRLDQLVPAHLDELQQLAPILDHVVAHAAGSQRKIWTLRAARHRKIRRRPALFASHDAAGVNPMSDVGPIAADHRVHGETM